MSERKSTPSSVASGIIRNGGMGAFRMWAMSEGLVVDAGSFREIMRGNGSSQLSEEEMSWGLVLSRDAWQTAIDQVNQGRLHDRKQHPDQYTDVPILLARVLPWGIMINDPRTQRAATQLEAAKASARVSGITYPY